MAIVNNLLFTVFQKNNSRRTLIACLHDQ